jgi:hypothetical protein
MDPGIRIFGGGKFKAWWSQHQIDQQQVDWFLVGGQNLQGF